MIPTIEYSIPIHLIQSFRILNIQFQSTYSDYSDNLIFNSNSPSTINLVEWAIASHGMYESALVFFNPISKQKNLYIVNYVQCDIQNQNTTMKNKQMLYLWLPEITHMRIRFWNYLFKADKRISHHL
jgi:hypothetical protein